MYKLEKPLKHLVFLRKKWLIDFQSQLLYFGFFSWILTFPLFFENVYHFSWSNSILDLAWSFAMISHVVHVIFVYLFTYLLKRFCGPYSWIHVFYFLFIFFLTSYKRFRRKLIQTQKQIMVVISFVGVWLMCFLICFMGNETVKFL